MGTINWTPFIVYVGIVIISMTIALLLTNKGE